MFEISGDKHGFDYFSLLKLRPMIRIQILLVKIPIIKDCRILN